MESPLVCENIFEAENNLQIRNTVTGTSAKKMFSETSATHWFLSPEFPLLGKLYEIISDICVQEMVARFWQNHLESEEQHK